MKEGLWIHQPSNLVMVNKNYTDKFSRFTYSGKVNGSRMIMQIHQIIYYARLREENLEQVRLS